MYHFNPINEWNSIHVEDLWVYNKLFLSRSLGYLCGPVGTSVPSPDHYIVLPSINLLGMGRFSRIEWIYKYTDHFHPAEFWCQRFYGDHLSVDFRNKKTELVVLGERDDNDSFYKWRKWTKIEKEIPFPEVLNNLKGNYEWINCEFVGNKLIEVHFRRNPDFRYGNSIAIPVWKGEETKEIDSFVFVDDEDYLRKGFYIDTRDSNPVKSSDFNESGANNDQKSR